MPLFLVVVVVGGAGALAEGAVIEVVIAELGAAEARFDMPVADGPAAQGHTVRPPEGQAARATDGQALLGGARITDRYATIPRLGLGFPAVLAQLVVKS